MKENDQGNLKPDLDSYLILDACWLSSCVEEIDRNHSIPDSAKSEKLFGDTSKKRESPSFPGNRSMSGQSAVSEKRKSEIRGFSDTQGEKSGGRRVRLRGPASVSQKLAIDRSFRRLRKKKPDIASLEIDLDATVNAFRENNILIPFFKPRLRRWIDLFVVFEVSPSMKLWEDTQQELVDAIRRAISPRTLRVYYLDSKEGKNELRSSHGAFMSIDSVVVPGRTNLLIFITDAGGVGWTSGSIPRQLQNWSRNSAVVLLQLLPSHLWDLNSFFRYPFTLERKNSHVSSWHVGAGGLHGVYVCCIEPKEFEDLSSLLIGRPASSVRRLLIDSRFLGGSDARECIKEEDQSEMEEADSIYADFIVHAHSDTQHLARCIAAIPSDVLITLSLMKLVQRCLIDDPVPWQLSEIMLSGMIEITGKTSWSDDPTYGFFADIRSRLIADAGDSLKFDVSDLISRYLQQKPENSTTIEVGVHDPEISTDEIHLASSEIAKVGVNRLLGGVSSASDSKENSKPSNLPIVNSVFYGRDQFLSQLREAFSSSSRPRKNQCLVGLGGIGKTRLAIEYANRYSEHYSALLFVVADSPESLRANIANLCGALRIDEPEPAKQYGAAIKWLQEHPGWFLIVDNVDTKEAARAVEESILGKLKEGHILVTSRLSAWRNRDLDPLELDVISEDASVELLLEGTDGQRKPTRSDNRRALELAKRLGCLPLALQQAVGFISARYCSFEEYLIRWDSAEKKVVEWHDEVELKYPTAIVTTWELSFDEMKPEGKKALRLICWLAPDPIPKALLYKVSKVPNSFDIEEGIAELENYSFLRWVDSEKDLVQVHALVSEIARYRMSELERRETIGNALATMKVFVENQNPSDPRTWPSIYEPCRAHLGQLIEKSEEMGIGEPTANLMDKLALFFLGIAAFEEAEPLFRRVLEISEASYGPNHPNVARGLNNLAGLLQETNRYSEAEPLYRRALEIDEASYGLDHPSVATGLSNLALLLQETNRTSEAEPLVRRALEIDEASYGPNHPNVARGLNNLARLLQETNRHDEAEPLLRHAIEIDKDSYGPYHPIVARGLNNLAGLLQDTNRHNEAEPLVRRALEIDEASYGPNHPNVARGLNNLAVLLYETNRPSEAELLVRRAVEIDEASYGPNHPKVATGLNNLAHLLQETNRHSEAEPLTRRALEIDEASFGPNHPKVARGLNNLARLLQDTNRHNEAEPLLRRALEIDEASYGPNHPSVARVLNNLAELLRETNRHSVAEPLIRRALEIDEASYGPNHPNVARGLNNLARLLQETNRHSEAEPLYRRALEIDEASYGPNHPNVARGLNNLARLLYETNRPSEAEPLLRRALEIDEASYGPNHPSVASGRNNPALLPQKTSGVAPGITNTAGWTAEQIEDLLRDVKKELDWDNTTGSARKWWQAFETENQNRIPLVLRLAEELRNRKATISEFFLAYVYSNSDDIMANLHYLDYMRLKGKEDRKNKGTRDDKE
jgi:tetratricopeptide (TPR) repeat protein